MKHTFLIATLFAFILIAAPSTEAQSGTNAAASTNAAEKGVEGYDKHVREILAALKLQDATKEKQVGDIVSEYLAASKKWHSENDSKIKPLWAEFGSAHTRHDDAGADAALDKIDAVYATFHPQHEKTITALSPFLTPAQIETVEDVLTVNKVKVTYTNYQKIFEGLKDDQKAFILKNLKAAREQAIDAGAMTEKSAFFKKYKTRIEAYLTAQGYDVKQSYKDFAAKMKADAAGKKPGETPAPE